MTPADLFIDAYGKSKKNQPGKIADEATELLGVANRAIRTFFVLAARKNPYFFMDDAIVALDTGSWLRPSNAEAIFLMEHSGVELVVVPIEDKQASTAKPAVYRKSQKYFGAGNSLNPTTGDVTFYFSRRPVDAATIASPIDPDFPEAYSEMPTLEIAIYLALKDGRTEDVQALVGERDGWLRLYLAFLEHETMNEHRRWENRFNLPSAAPIASMLQGGTSVEL